MTGGERVLYLYGVIPAGQDLPAGTGQALRTVEHASLAALVEPVDAAEFAPEKLDEKLAALEWVTGLAQKHEAVLEAAARLGAVVPSRLCTLFSSEEALRLSLAANESGFLAGLERVRGREEWGLKVLCDEAELRSVLGPGDPHVRAFEAAAASASPGHAFVLGKKRDARLAEIAAAHIDGVLDETIDLLEPETADLRVLRSLLPADGQRVLNLAALVDAEARESFHAAVAELAERFGDEGFRFEMSGPWPPYNFCTGDGEDG